MKKRRIVNPNNSITAIIRFLQKINITKTCWIWIANIIPNSGGYGLFWNGKQNILAHRFSYSYFNGTIPDEKTIDHICNNPSCVNPLHLRLLTMKENILRGNGAGAKNARKTHCPYGHKFTNKNIIRVVSRGKVLGKQCRKCNNIHQRKYYWKRKSENP